MSKKAVLTFLFRDKKDIFAFLPIFAVGCIVASAIVFVWNAVFVAHSNIVPGEVVEIEERRSDSGGILFRPVVEYFDDTGKQHTFVPRHWHSPAMYKKGDSVFIAYHQKNRDRVAIYDFVNLGIWPFTFFIIGLGQIIVLVILDYGKKIPIVQYFFPANKTESRPDGDAIP